MTSKRRTTADQYILEGFSTPFRWSVQLYLIVHHKQRMAKNVFKKSSLKCICYANQINNSSAYIFLEVRFLFLTPKQRPL